MLSDEAIRSNIIRAVEEDIRVVPRAAGGCYIGTPFRFGDGDPLNILLTESADGSLTLTDEADTLAHLSYFGVFPKPDTLGIILASHSMEVRDGRIVHTGLLNPSDIGEAILEYAQGLQKIADAEIWQRRRRPKGKFAERMCNTVEEVFGSDGVCYDCHLPELDPGDLYVIDCHITRAGRELCLYAADNNLQAMESIISTTHYKNAGRENMRHYIVINPDGSVSRKVQRQATEVAHKTFLSLPLLRSELAEYIAA